MNDILRKTLLAGIGLAAVTKEKAEEIGTRLLNDANLSEEEGRQFVEELKKKSGDARLALEKIIGDVVTGTLEKLEIPSRKEMNDLKKRVDNLESPHQG